MSLLQIDDFGIHKILELSLLSWKIKLQLNLQKEMDR